MKRVLSVIMLLALLLLAGCRTTKPSTSLPVIVYNTDSVRTEIVEKIIVDTVFINVPVPAESTSQVVKDSTSHLETSIAWSDAWLNPDGTLGHNLHNKKVSLPAEIPVQHKEKETNNNKAQYKEVPVPYPEYVEVERDFTAWEKFRLNSFWYLVGGLAISLVWIFRKSLFSALIRLFRL